MSNDSLFNRPSKKRSIDTYFMQVELENALYWAGYIHFKKRNTVQDRPMPWEDETEKEYL